MAKHLTKKQEGFINEYMEHGDASRAYRTCYNASNMADKTIWEKASVLLHSGKVTARLQQLQRELSERNLVSLDGLTSDLKRIMKSSEEVGQFGSAVASVKQLAAMHGLGQPKQPEANQQVHLSAFRMVPAFSEGSVPLPSSSGTGPEMRGVLEPGDVVPGIH